MIDMTGTDTKAVALAERVDSISEAQGAKLGSKWEALLMSPTATQRVAQYVANGGSEVDTVGLVLAARKLNNDATRATGGVAVAVYAIAETQDIKAKDIAQAIGLSEGRVSQLRTEGQAFVALGITGSTDPQVMTTVRKLTQGKGKTELASVLGSGRKPENKIKAVLALPAKLAKVTPNGRTPRPASEHTPASDPRTGEGAQAPTPAQDPSAIPAGTEVRMLASFTDGAAWLGDNLASLTASQLKIVASNVERLAQLIAALPAPEVKTNGRARRQARQAAAAEQVPA